MSYDNAEPKILKTLNSEGQVLDDSGNVIGETSDYWVQLYNQTEPKVDKILHSDGTIKDSAGNLIQDTTEFNVEKYKIAEPIPAKYLHADGTIDENPGAGSGANLEDNKEIEITENGEIEITPSNGYDGMKKVTANINVSGSGGQIAGTSTIPCYKDDDSILFAFDENWNFITDKNEVVNAKRISTMTDSGNYTNYYIDSENPFNYSNNYQVDNFEIADNDLRANEIGGESYSLANYNWDRYQLAEISIVDIITMPRMS